MLGFLRGKALGLRLRQPVNEFWDRRLGVRTFGYNPGWGEGGSPAWLSPYVPLSYPELFDALRIAGLDRTSVFTDLGCGLGRAVFAAASFAPRAVVGVEVVDWLAEAARANHRRSRFAKADIRILTANALDHSIGDTTHLYFFHSFGPDVMIPVFDRARAARAAGRIRTPLRLIYANPVHNDVIAGLGWMRQTHMLKASRRWFSDSGHYDCAIWESTDQDSRPA